MYLNYENNFQNVDIDFPQDYNDVLINEKSDCSPSFL